MLTLYGDNTAINVRKITIALAELGLDYQRECVDRSRGDQMQESFAKISPNARMPVIKDDVGDTIVWESGAILIYLCDRYDESGLLLPRDGAARYAALQGAFFQAANIGPTLGRLNSQLTADVNDRIPGMQDIFMAETVRLTEVLDRMLSDERLYIAGQYSIADIMLYPWLKAGLDMRFPALVEKPRLPAWLERIGERPAVQAGMAVTF